MYQYTSMYSDLERYILLLTRVLKDKDTQRYRKHYCTHNMYIDLNKISIQCTF